MSIPSPFVMYLSSEPYDLAALSNPLLKRVSGTPEVLRKSAIICVSVAPAICRIMATVQPVRSRPIVQWIKTRPLLFATALMAFATELRSELFVTKVEKSVVLVIGYFTVVVLGMLLSGY